MPRWLSTVLLRIAELATQRKVHFTLKALRELDSLGLELDVDDVIQLLENLTSSDSEGRIMSKQTGEWMYVFKPCIIETVVYLKLIVRNNCIVISCHKDEEGENEEK